MRSYGESASSSSSAHPAPLTATPSSPHGVPSPAGPGRGDWATLRRLFPYLWQYKWRVLAALAFMVAAKGANVGVPLLLKRLVDAMTLKPGDPAAVLVVPAAQAFAMLDTNRIMNATAMVCLWWLRHHRTRLRQEWA
jgi:ATP-binding cassette subfamily B protein